MKKSSSASTVSSSKNHGDGGSCQSVPPDDEARSLFDRLSVIEARAHLANELHDSLAQTLASLRIQVRVLDETLHQGDESVTWQELEKMENSIEEANDELRDLIARFRAPIQESEVVTSIEKLIEKFKRETEIPVFLQNEWQSDVLPAEMRQDIVSIVQEALTNIHKHADAKTVRVMLRHKDSAFQLLVEDDGDGFLQSECEQGGPGEHIGLKIMRERGANLDGDLAVESDVGEGTRVTLKFDHPVATNLVPG